MHSYLTISSPSYGEYRDRGSKFYAYAYPLEGENELKTRLEELKEKYPDATHHCYALVTGKEGEIQRSSDAGEPANSAGKPILRQILSAKLSHVLVIVVRYFGGTQLGIPGLINAYGEAAKAALQASDIVEKQLESKFRLVYHYADEGVAFRLIKQLGGRIIQIDRGENANVDFYLNTGRIPELESLKEKFYNIEIQNID